MLTFKEQLRFTRAEIEEARRLGIDLSSVRTRGEYSEAVIRLVRTLSEERPALLEKIARTLSARTGRPMPARLRRVR
jgi:hypothetical protein